MRNVSDKVVDKIEARILGPITYFENSAVYEIIPKNIVQPDRPRMTICARTFIAGYVRLQIVTKNI